ncbi:hypothetical protein FOTG_01105 [Fusarium oxysporum f. sp. vasinfectum 25433]|uniref:Uncharacterized protein n=1 Tax=Fusarium oxysporum f. sp. vasinfectum 25433 TaxID=1089449 RepID=X0MGL9_FUSOX|nr:hypothetical protein FOTG_01105 [Fusarium oxysporum f. sp. vasinfectum 25433]
MHGSDGGMVTYLDEAISKAVQCEISSKASGYWYRTPTEPVQLRDSLPLGSGPGALPTLVHAPRRLFLALVRLCFIHHDLGSSIDLFSVYVVDELLLSICTCE